MIELEKPWLVPVKARLEITDLALTHIKKVEANPEVKTDGDNFYVAPSASVIGRVFLGTNTSIWFGAVIRGDVEDSYYADLAESWYMLSMKVEEEIKKIAGAY